MLPPSALRCQFPTSRRIATEGTGSELIVPGCVFLDRDSDKVVAGLVPLRSAQAASHGGKTMVKVVCRYVEGVQETFTTTWPAIEAAASQLTKNECEVLLLELLKCDAPCVKQDKGRRVASALDISRRQLKRLRKRAREQQHVKPGVLTKKRKSREKNLSEKSSAPMDATSASNAPEDQAPVEADGSVSAAPTLATDLAKDSHSHFNTTTAVSLDQPPLASEAAATSSNHSLADQPFETLPSDNAEGHSMPTDEVVTKASA